MNNKQLTLLVLGTTVGIYVGCAYMAARKVSIEERTKRQKWLDQVGLDVAAVHNATDVVNAKIDRGEIRSYDQLREAVLMEVDFQKIAIREQLDPEA